MSLVVTSVLTSADVSLTLGSRSPDETDGAAVSVTHSIFVRFVQKTLPGNTPVVGTMIIPSVASAAKDTGSGLLPPSVT